MINDKQTDYQRYDARAKDLLSEGVTSVKEVGIASVSMPPVLQAPYLYYEQCIGRYISHNSNVLEIGSGTGLHTHALVQTGASVVASDISSHSLDVLLQRIGKKVKTKVADMEMLPFEDNTFDVVTSAGSLSYGDPEKVNAEIIRVLRPGGFFICVDSLNHNPIYQINRYIHYLKGKRTKSTLLRMPTIERIQNISRGFQSREIRYFGAISYLMPMLARFIGQARAAKISDAVDKIVCVHRSAFKFVLVAKNRL